MRFIPLAPSRLPKHRKELLAHRRCLGPWATALRRTRQAYFVFAASKNYQCKNFIFASIDAFYCSLVKSVAHATTVTVEDTSAASNGNTVTLANPAFAACPTLIGCIICP
jgi:hypothetical protein